MIKLPDFNKAFEYENNFYLSCDKSRISKLIAQYELHKRIINVPGEIVECGVFKGASFLRLALFQSLFSVEFSKKVIGFDTFGKFPESDLPQDVENIEGFFSRAGDQSISREQLMGVLKNNNIDQYCELVEGDIIDTVPAYVDSHPGLKISLLNLDCDFYKASRRVLEHLYPRLENNGILILDNYKDFAGETMAVDEYFKGQAKIHRFPYSDVPYFIVKGEWVD